MPSNTALAMLKQPPRLTSITSLPLGAVHPLHRAVAGDAGIVDEHVDRAELGLDLGDAGVAGVEIGDVPFVGVMPVRSVKSRARSSLPA